MSTDSSADNSSATGLSHSQTVLALLPPPTPGEKVAVNEPQVYKFDHLGPVVVNKDGTLSRVANWDAMTPMEKERTLRILVARNQVRLANQGTLQDIGSDQERLSLSRND